MHTLPLPQHRKILVIGASGFIGSHICQLAQRLGNTVDGTFFTNESVRVPNCRYHELDARNRAEVFTLLRKTRPNIIIHAAGTRDLDFCENYPEKAIAAHIQTTQNITDASLAIEAYVVYISTDCIFDGTKRLFFEEDIPNPFNQYGRLKYAAESILLDSTLSTLILRTSLLFGWALPTQASNTVMDVYRMLKNSRPIQMPTEIYNTPLYVGTAAQVILKAAGANLQGTFHLAGKERLSRFELALNTAAEFGFSPELIRATRETSGLRPVNSCLGSARLETALDITLSNTRTGLRSMRLRQNAVTETALTKDIDHETGPFSRRL